MNVRVIPQVDQYEKFKNIICENSSTSGYVTVFLPFNKNLSNFQLFIPEKIRVKLDLKKCQSEKYLFK